MTNRHPKPRLAPSANAQLRRRLAEAEETLRAIRNGEVDAVVVAGADGDQVFTLDGAGRAYRVLIESMNEGALTLTVDAMILYANRCFAKMMGCPLEQVMGTSFRRFLSAEDSAAFQRVLERPEESGAKIQVRLLTADGPPLPAQISLRALAKGGSDDAALGLVVTDLTEARRNEERLRALTHRVVQAQETERSRVAREVHDRITQPLCAIAMQSQALVADLSVRPAAAKKAAIELRELLGRTAEEAERISRDLQPSVLVELGLAAVLTEAGAEFARRTGVRVKVTCGPLTVPLPPATELALYRIVQEALKNAGKHARARHVTVDLSQQTGFAQMAISDDGIGFDLTRLSGKRRAGLGLLGMRERATHVSGDFTVKSARRAGTMIRVRLPG